jgi:hypothetical protein
MWVLEPTPPKFFFITHPVCPVVLLATEYIIPGYMKGQVVQL